MSYKPYNGFSGEQREAADKYIKAAIKSGTIKPATKCNRCQQDKGIIHHHLEDYDFPITQDKIEELCWRCHMVWHCRFRAPKQAEQYFAEVAYGIIWPPVFKHDFNILKQHGI